MNYFNITTHFQGLDKMFIMKVRYIEKRYEIILYILFSTRTGKQFKRQNYCEMHVHSNEVRGRI